jgi:hypothetical protein
MATKKTVAKVTKNPIEKAHEELNRRLSVLEKQVQQLVSQKPKARKQREYSDEERASIRARLLAGQEVARKKRENEHKAKPNGKTTIELKKVVNPQATPITKLS